MTYLYSVVGSVNDLIVRVGVWNDARADIDDTECS